MYEHCQTSGIFITLPPICATFPHKETLTYTNSMLGFVEETLLGFVYRKPQRKTIGVSRDFLNSPGSAIVRAAKWRNSHERDTEPAEMSDAGLTSGVGWSQMDWTHTHTRVCKGHQHDTSAVPSFDTLFCPAHHGRKKLAQELLCALACQVVRRARGKLCCFVILVAPRDATISLTDPTSVMTIGQVILVDGPDVTC